MWSVASPQRDFCLCWPFTVIRQSYCNKPFKGVLANTVPLKKLSASSTFFTLQPSLLLTGINRGCQGAGSLSGSCSQLSFIRAFTFCFFSLESSQNPSPPFLLVLWVKLQRASLPVAPAGMKKQEFIPAALG